jgi:Flp pilus assembly pilin Flp
MPAARPPPAVDYAALVALVAIAVLCAAVPTGDRTRGLFTWTNETVNDGIAGLPLPDDGGSGQPSANGQEA